METINEDLVTRTELARVLRVSRATTYSWQRDPNFPKPIVIGPRTTRFRAAEIREWLANRPVMGVS